MKVCLVSEEYPPDSGGGIATQTSLKAQGLAALGHEVHVITTGRADELVTALDRGVVVHRLPDPDTAVPGYETSTYLLAHSFAVAERLTALDAANYFDVVQFPEYAGEGFVYQTDTFANRTARYVVQLHGPLAMFAEHMGWPELDSPMYSIGTFMEQTVIRHADQVIASSRNTADFCAWRYGVDREAVEVVHSAVDPEEFAPRMQPAGGRHPRLLFVGNLNGNKGVWRVVRSAMRLARRYPDISLRLIGLGDEQEAIEREVAKSGSSARIELVGYVPRVELPAHYAWCDFFVGPSDYEPGPGNVYLEAMACGKPVIAGNTGGAPEVVRHEGTGLLVDPLDPTALDASICRLADEAALRHRLGAAGRATVERQFSLDSYIARIERIYAALAADALVGMSETA
jgi:glycogen(starch) synthase